MTIHKKVYALLVVFLYVGQVSANTDKTITWYKPEFPPLSIVNGSDAGKGYSDRIENYLIQEMGSFDHVILVSPFKRTLRDMKKGLNACSVTLLKTPARSEFIAFTKPARLLLPNDLVVRKADLSKFNHFKDESGRISLEKIIQSGTVRIGYSNGRSYTKPIDALLAKYKGSEKLIERLGNEGPKGLLTMLTKGNIDAMFAQPVEAQFHGRSIGVASDIVQLPIKEIKEYTVGYIGCSKTPWGEAVIKKIDALLVEAVKRDDFRRFYEDFLDEDSKRRYRKIYAEYFKLK
ncbi:TIGR02285 family protein [Neptunomonas antarctica]|uniref:Solute-binding protein family 3/N-terminal domain-containing protein n=1 Tax=Neptunomonas antarctica TaxID=619304 RepID=A0A1N7KZV9_9GAMM|nr:TIGR02285 family protein [Neptunomonas antarctica]SIS67114.1 conserved hypothetical protein [Neptunomonas antarctica]